MKSSEVGADMVAVVGGIVEMVVEVERFESGRREMGECGRRARGRARWVDVSLQGGVGLGFAEVVYRGGLVLLYFCRHIS